MVATKKAVLRVNGMNWAIPHRRPWRHREHLAWAALVLASAAIPASAGPNLVAVGSFDLPQAGAEVNESLTGEEIYYTFSGEHDFGRVVVRTSEHHSVVRRDNSVKVYYSGTHLVVNLEDLRGRDRQVTVWFRLDGHIRPGRTYEYVFDMAMIDESRPGGIPAVIPAIWLDGELTGTEVTLTTPILGEKAAKRMQRGLLTRGKVTIPDYDRRTGGAWILMEIPPDVPKGMGFRWVSFREIDDELLAGDEPEMPTPVRYIHLRSPIAGRVDRVMEFSARALAVEQNEDGSWGPDNDAAEQAVITSLVATSLTEWKQDTRTTDDSDEIRRRLDAVARLKRARRFLADLRLYEDEKTGDPAELTTTLSVAARLMCLARSPDPQQYRRTMSSDVSWLVQAQMKDGGWTTFNPEIERGESHLVHSDNLSTEQAVTALREAHFSGVTCKRSVWRNAAKYSIMAQSIDGGFREKADQYGGLGKATNVLQTAGGLSVLLTALDLGYGALGTSCTSYMANGQLRSAIDEAIEWMDANYGEDVFYKDVGGFDPLEGANPYYVSLAMQQLDVSSGIRRFNDKDHFTEQAELLLQPGRFDPATGLFQGDLNLTAMALRTLSGGAAPTVLQRIVAGDVRGAQHSADAHHLSRYLMAARQEPLNWRRTTIDRPIRDLLTVPVTLVKIVGEFDWSQAEWHKLREYCFGGGSIILDVVTKDATLEAQLHDQLTVALQATFPEYTLRPLSSDSPLFASERPLGPVPSARVLGNGFRDFLFIPDQNWSCAWHLNQTRDESTLFEFIDRLVEFTVGEEELRSTFDPPTYEIGARPDREVKVAFLETGSTIPAYPDAGQALNRLMQANYRVEVGPATSGDEGAVMMWVSATGAQPMSDSVRQRIQRHIQRGGLLFADVVSGHANWGEQLSADLLRVDRSLSLAPLRQSHPLLTGEISGSQGFDVRNPLLRAALRTRFTDRGRCDFFALLRNDQMVGVITHTDVISGLGYTLFPDCRGPMPDDARKLAMNAMLLAMRHQHEQGSGLAQK